MENDLILWDILIDNRVFLQRNIILELPSSFLLNWDLYHHLCQLTI